MGDFRTTACFDRSSVLSRELANSISDCLGVVRRRLEQMELEEKRRKIVENFNRRYLEALEQNLPKPERPQVDAEPESDGVWLWWGAPEWANLIDGLEGYGLVGDVTIVRHALRSAYDTTDFLLPSDPHEDRQDIADEREISDRNAKVRGKKSAKQGRKTKAGRANFSPSATLHQSRRRAERESLRHLREFLNGWTAPVGAAQLSTPCDKKRPGRKKADYETVHSESQIAADWVQARDAGVYKGDFAKQRGLKVKDLDRLLTRVRMRKVRTD